MAAASEQPAWYRIYVLFVLLAVCASNLACRNLPSYLVTVPVPDCEDLCAGVAVRPLCGGDIVDTFPTDREPTTYEQCQLCRARVLPVSIPAGPVLDPRRAEASIADEQAAPSLGLHQANHSRAPKRRHPAVHLQVLRSNTSGDVQSPATVGLQTPAGRNSQQYLVRVEHSGQAFAYWAGVSRQDASFYSLADGACLYHWKYGLLIGYGFAAVFALGEIPAGPTCDSRSRVGIASVSLMAWSVATSMQASAHSFWALLACRAVVGLSQAFAIPAAASLVADYFPDAQAAAALVLSVGVYLGSGCASFSLLLASVIGWRWATLLAGLPGMLLVPILQHTVREPDRTEWTAPCSMELVREEVFEKSRVARLMLVAATAKMLAAHSLAAFLPIWYSRRSLEGYTSSGFACCNAMVIPMGGLLSTLVGSVLNLQWSHWDARAPCWIGLLGSLLSLPLVCMVLLTTNFGVSMLSLFLLLLASESWFGPTVTLLRASVRRSVRGQAVSLFLVTSTLAANLGPALVGILDPGGERIRLHLLWICIAANLIAAAAFVQTAREISVDPVAIGLGSPGGDPQKDKVSGQASAALWSLF